MKYAFIKDKNVDEFTVARFCKVLDISRGGYYDWLKREPSKRQRSKVLLDGLIKTTHEKGLKAYGSPRVYKALVKKGIKCALSTIEQSMKSQGLKSVHHKRFRPCTTDSSNTKAPAPNLLNREFDAQAPNQKWVSDITYISTAQGWTYLCVVLDLFSRKIVGYSTSARIDAELVTAAFKAAVVRRGVPKQLLFHSDRGSQYDSDLFRKNSAIPGLNRSMSRTANCYDNAVCESFFKTLKVEFVYQNCFGSRENATRKIIGWIETFYNTERLHSSIDFKSPVELELEYATLPKAVA